MNNFRLFAKGEQQIRRDSIFFVLFLSNGDDVLNLGVLVHWEGSEIKRRQLFSKVGNSRSEWHFENRNCLELF